MKWQAMIFVVLLPDALAQGSAEANSSASLDNLSNVTLVARSEAEASLNYSDNKTTQITNRTVTKIDRNIVLYLSGPDNQSNKSDANDGGNRSNSSVTELQVQIENQDFTITDLRFREIVEAFKDFIHRIKLILAVSEDTKVEVLKDRNEELKDRQQEWVSLKNKVVADFGSRQVDPEQKQAIIKQIQSEHQKIIKESVQMTTEIKKIEASLRNRVMDDLVRKVKRTSQRRTLKNISMPKVKGWIRKDIFKISPARKRLRALRYFIKRNTIIVAARFASVPKKWL